MSFEAMAWAVKWDLPVKQKITLLMLSNRINSDTGRCFPSVKGLAADCGMSETSVREALRSLKEAGIIIVHERKIEGVSLSNEYEVDLSKFPPPLRNTQYPPAPDAVPPLRNTHPNLSLEPINEPETCEVGFFSEEEAPKIDKTEEAFQRFWSVYPKKAGKPAAHRNFLRAVKDGADPEIIINAAKIYAGSDAVHRGFAKHPQGWLNDQRWADEDLKPVPQKPRFPAWGEIVR